MQFFIYTSTIGRLRRPQTGDRFYIEKQMYFFSNNIAYDEKASSESDQCSVEFKCTLK